MQTTIFEILTDLKCCECHATFGMPQSVMERYRVTKKGFYCPYCAQVQGFYGKNEKEKELDRVKQELEAQKLKTERAKEEAKREWRSKVALRGQLTKVKKRVHAGVCLHCNRSFRQLAAHMRTKHPEVCDAA